MSIFSEMYKIRKEIYILEQKLKVLNGAETAKNQEADRQIDELLSQIEHLKIKAALLEKLEGKYHPGQADFSD